MHVKGMIHLPLTVIHPETFYYAKALPWILLQTLYPASNLILKDAHYYTNLCPLTLKCTLKLSRSKEYLMILRYSFWNLSFF